MTKQYVCGEGGTWSPLARVFSGWKSGKVSIGQVTVLEQIKLVSSRRIFSASFLPGNCNTEYRSWSSLQTCRTLWAPGATGPPRRSAKIFASCGSAPALTTAQWEKKGGYEDKVSKWPLSMCNRYTNAQSEICPHCFPECTGEAGVQCQVSVFSADAGVTRPSRPAATRVLPVRH